MKQLAILSGKGGTGKTTIASSLINLFNSEGFADCDVDAPNLHLIFSDYVLDKKEDYYAMPKACIDHDKCIGCGICKEFCRFDAIDIVDGIVEINTLNCEGCAVCSLKCPCNAISLKETKAGQTFINKKNNKIFSTAQLEMGNGTSGKLVTEVKKNLRNNIKTDKIIIIDGSPGIGCPVISSLSGVDAVLIVTEPSLSGLADLKRIIQVAQTFNIKIMVCINRYDINMDLTTKIKDYCKNNDFKLVGEIPYDKEAINAINSGKSVIEVDCKCGKAIRNIFEGIKESI